MLLVKSAWEQHIDRNDGGNAVEIGRGIGGTVLNGNGFTLTKIGTNDLKLAEQDPGWRL